METLYYLCIALSMLLCVLFTPVVRYLARRYGLVSRPRKDRWSKQPTALMGGIAIFAALIPACLPLFACIEQGWVVLGAAGWMFLIGVVDDLRNLKPYQKLIAQIMAAMLVILGGLSLPWTQSGLCNMALTVFWLVGITNAVNLLDNMDGLAAGVCAVAGGFLSASFFDNNQVPEGILLAAFSAALLGFLLYNFNPASIFMGDCGSLFLGFFLASASLLHINGGRSRSLLSVLAVPVLLLVIPIFDTTLVTLLRKISGRAASQGGRDHTSHRLVALGLSERSAVGLLYLLAAISGLLAYLVRQLSADVSLALITFFILGLTLLGTHLARVKVYEEGWKAGNRVLVAFLVDLSYKRRLFEVLLDVVLISLAYYLANLITFGPLEEHQQAKELLLATLPLLVFLKLGAFLLAGVYRGLWKYISLLDIWVYLQGVLAGTLLSICTLLLLFRFENFSRVVFILDGLLLACFLISSRLVFRLLRKALPLKQGQPGRRVLIYGAGDAGELLVRELRNNLELESTPVGFADDDPNKWGRVIHGLRVLGGNGSLLEICNKHQIQEVVISSEKFSQERVQEIQKDLRTQKVTLKRMRIHMETLLSAEDEISKQSA